MSSFHLHFLLEDSDRVSAGAPRQIFLAGFGKHPGWDDHLEDIGLVTRTLEAAKSLLYIDGIGNQIDTGAWDKLEPGQLGSFNHLFVWCRSDQILLGRIWSSSDGKGRTKYPMIACLHSFGLPLAWLLAKALPRLNDLVQKCRATNEAGTVVQAFKATQAELQALAHGVSPSDLSSAAGTHERQRARFLGDPVLGKEGEGLTRVLYCLERQMGAYLPMKKLVASQTGWPAPQQIRVPRFEAAVEDNALMWSWFFATQCAKSTPTLLLLPLDAPWVDVILGKPTGHDLFCLRASSQVLALATTIPYTLDAAAREKAAQSLAALRLAGPTPSGPAAKPVSAGEQKFEKWLFVTLVLVVVVGGALIAIWYFRGSPARSPVPALPKANPAPPPVKSASQMDQPSGLAPAATQGKLLLTSDPPAVEIYWRTKTGDQLLGTTGDTVLRTEPIDQGTQILVARHPILGEQVLSVDVTTDAVVAVNVVFPYGSVRIQSAATSAVPAMVYQGTTKLGPTPWFGAISRTGIVHYVVQAEGFSPVNLEGEVLAGKTNELMAALIAGAADSKFAALHPKFRNSIGMELVWLNGVPGTDGGCWVGTTEVTWREFHLVMGGTNRESRAASYSDAREFCHKLSQLESNAAVYYDLPNAEQWSFLIVQPHFENSMKSRGATGEPGRTNPPALFDGRRNTLEVSLPKSPGAGSSNEFTLQPALAWDDDTPPELSHQRTSAGFRCLAVLKPKSAGLPVQ